MRFVHQHPPSPGPVTGVSHGTAPLASPHFRRSLPRTAASQPVAEGMGKGGGFRGTESNAKTVLCTRCAQPQGCVGVLHTCLGATPVEPSVIAGATRLRHASEARGGEVLTRALYPPQVHVPGGLPLRRPLQLRARDGRDQAPAGGRGGTRPTRHARCGGKLRAVVKRHFGVGNLPPFRACLPQRRATASPSRQLGRPSSRAGGRCGLAATR